MNTLASMDALASTWPVLVTGLALIAVLAENALSMAGLGLFGRDEEG